MLGIVDEKNLCIKCREEKDAQGLIEHFNNFLELLNFNLIQNEPFYGTFLMNMKRTPDMELPTYAACNLIKSVMIFYYNPALLIDLDNREIVAVIKHEIFHIMNCHLLRAKEYNLNRDSFEHHQLNIAMDASINQLIEGLPKNCITLKYLEEHYQLHNLEARREFEYYYDLIKSSKQYEKEKKEHKERQKNLQEVLDKINDARSKGEKPMLSDEDIKKLTEAVVGEELADYSHNKWRESSEADLENMKETVREMIQGVSDKLRGNIPGEVKSILAILNEPPVIPWQEELKNMIGSVKCPYKKTLLRRPRRQPNRYDLKGRLSDRKVKITVAIDTSGSMSDDDVAWCFNEIFQIIKTVKFELEIIECDCEITRVYTAKTINDIDTKVTGRGGTSFEPVFKYIKENRNKKPDLLIYFTDGYGESEFNEIYRPKGYEVMWVLTEEANTLSLKDPFTKKIKALHISARGKKR